MAKLRAPEGGAIVNGTYFTGGKFLPRILKRIKAVRKNAKPVQLARVKMTLSEDEQAHLRGINPGDSVGMASFADRLEENDHPLHALFSQIVKGHSVGVTSASEISHIWDHGKIGPDIYVRSGVFKGSKQPFIAVNHLLPHEQGQGRTYRNYAAKVSVDQFRALHDKLAGTRMTNEGIAHAKQGIPKRGLKNPKQLAREQEAPHVSYARILPDGGESFSMPTLKHEDIVHLEEHHKVPEKKRLTKSANYKYDPATGHIQNAKVEHLHSFLDAIAASPETSLPKGLRGEKLFTHLLTHAVKDAKTYLPLVQGEWYTGSVQKMDKTLHDILSREKPFHPDSKKYDEHPLWGKAGDQTPALKLFKTIIGFTSNNQDPASNLVSALKILKTGVDKDPLRPFEGMEQYNTAPMHDFLAQLAKKHNATNLHYVGLTPEEHTAWHQKFGADLLKVTRAGSAPVSVVEGLKDTNGRIVGRKNITGKEVDMAGNPLPKGKYERVLFPALTPEGQLKPKGWSSRAQTNAYHIQLLKTIIQNTGGYEQAARWLEERHPKQEVDRMRGSKVKTGELENPELGVPGAFVFGEKQGPFMANISGNPEHVTQDVWWTRSINRWLGKLTKNASAPNTSQKQFYARVAREAAKELGTTPANLQAILWYAEQHMHRLFGTKSESLDFADAAKRARAVYGFPPDSE